MTTIMEDKWLEGWAQIENGQWTFSDEKTARQFFEEKKAEISALLEEEPTTWRTPADKKALVAEWQKAIDFTDEWGRSYRTYYWIRLKVWGRNVMLLKDR